ncbi:MAG: HPr(Ser) kinase/phosphatase [Lautropia sp.]|nr:HPr(Ser) kinase/phosphatase [Lautropia sp.]
MTLTVQSLIEIQQGRTDLSWLAGQNGQQRVVGNPDTSVEDQVGYMNMMHAERIGVLGPRELNYYRQISDGHRQKLHEALVAAKPPALIVAEAQVVPQALIDFCNEAQLPLLISPLTPGPLIESLKQFLGQKTKDHTSLHGVLMDVLGMGVLITGDSGLGKSELALELISRGHGLVADDVVDIERVNHHTIVGRCPTLLQGLLEVRGLGLIDIRTIFGESAVRRRISIKLIVHLVRRSTLENRYERLPLEALTETVLGIPVRKVAIPVAAGRNIAVLTETAVRTTVLALRGIDTTREFVKRQQAAIMESLAANEATAQGQEASGAAPSPSQPPPPPTAPPPN